MSDHTIGIITDEKEKLNRIIALTQAMVMLRAIIQSYSNGTFGIFNNDPAMASIRGIALRKAREINDELYKYGVILDY